MVGKLPAGLRVAHHFVLALHWSPGGRVGKLGLVDEWVEEDPSTNLGDACGQQ